jgi:hypothetical protein
VCGGEYESDGHKMGVHNRLERTVAGGTAATGTVRVHLKHNNGSIISDML